MFASVNYLTLLATGFVQVCKVKTGCSIRAEMADGQRREGRNLDTATGNFAVSAPTISLPEGGGAIHSMGERFAANPVTGTGSMSVLIATSFERSGFGPRPSLSYDSGGGNEPSGFDWAHSIPAITRKTDKGCRGIAMPRRPMSSFSPGPKTWCRFCGRAARGSRTTRPSGVT